MDRRIQKLEGEISSLAKALGQQHMIHERFGFLKYYRHALILPNGRRPNQQEIKWCIDNCSGSFSQDHTCKPFSLSFEKESDMIMFKLAFGVGKPKHVRY